MRHHWASMPNRGGSLPARAGKIKQIANIGLAAASLAAAWAIVVPAAAETGLPPALPRRIVSINLCTDELLMDLVAPERITAVSTIASNPALSAMVAEAHAFPATGGSAEEVLKLAPDLVLAGSFTRRETRELLTRMGYRLATFDPVSSLNEATAEIRRAAGLLATPETGEKLIARIDSALARAAGAGNGLSVLALERRGFVSGRDTLIADLLARMGAHNTADVLGIASVAHVTTEAIIAARPDALLLDERITHATDQGSALLMHPALAELVPAAARVVLPAPLITCAGPTLPRAIDTLATALRSVPRVSASTAKNDTR